MPDGRAVYVCHASARDRDYPSCFSSYLHLPRDIDDTETCFARISSPPYGLCPPISRTRPSTRTSIVSASTVACGQTFFPHSSVPRSPVRPSRASPALLLRMRSLLCIGQVRRRRGRGSGSQRYVQSPRASILKLKPWVGDSSVNDCWCERILQPRDPRCSLTC